MKEVKAQDQDSANPIRIRLLCGVTMAAVIAIAFVPRIPQSEVYHNFSDQRTLLGIPNCLDVISNLPFLFIGIAGLLFLSGADFRNNSLERSQRWPYVMFFLGVSLTCFGSAYYHLSPSTERLMWDRLPMTVAFMSLLSAMVAERINVKAGLALLLPLLLIGVGSVLYWRLSERSGAGDLRPYILVQYVGALVIVLIVAMFSQGSSRDTSLVGVLFFYGLAKVLELLDAPIFALGGSISGHTLKHLSAAISVWFILRTLQPRSRTAITKASELKSEGILPAS